MLGHDRKKKYVLRKSDGSELTNEELERITGKKVAAFLRACSLVLLRPRHPWTYLLEAPDGVVEKLRRHETIRLEGPTVDPEIVDARMGPQQSR